MAKPRSVAAAVARQRWGRFSEHARRASGGDGRRLVAASIGAAALATSVFSAAQMPTAQAIPCPDAEVIFARGTTEAPGVGPTGEAFVDALRARTVGKSLGVYAVDYPATIDFPTAVDGINDARAHILATVANCPTTKLVLGGFSQGAAVMGFVTANVVPEGVSPADVPAPMPPEVANHVVGVALFGKPSTRFMRAINDPAVTIGPQYAGKTIDLCVDNDLVCDTSGRSFSAHNTYIDGGMVDQGATFVANLLQASWAADAAAQSSATGAAPGPQVPSAPSPLSAPAVPVPQAPAVGIADATPHLPAAPVPAVPPAVAAAPAPAGPVI